jgi:hypothetical protein
MPKYKEIQEQRETYTDEFQCDTYSKHKKIHKILYYKMSKVNEIV